MSVGDGIVERAQAGDQAAFRELFREHRGDVTRLVTRILGGTADVEDVVQDVFVHVFRSLSRFRGDSKFSTWLYRLTVNVTRMHLRKARSRPRVVDVPVPEQAARGPMAAPDAQTDQWRAARVLERLLAELSDKKRVVLVLHDFEGIAPKEIAQIVEAPVMTVRTRLFYARRELYAAIASDPQLGPWVSDAVASVAKAPDVSEGSGAKPRHAPYEDLGRVDGPRSEKGLAAKGGAE